MKLADQQPVSRIDWRGADLRSINLQGVSLEYADLRGADLRGVNFAGMNLKCADLRGAMAQHANFQNASLYGATAHLVGVLIALQDQRRMTREMALQLVSENIEAGNAEAIGSVLRSEGTA